MEYFECVVIGSGAAGMTAAIYLKRSNIDLVIIEKGAPGGQMNSTFKIDNYPGIASVEGPELSMNMYKQITDLGINYKYGNVIDIINMGDHKIVKTGDNEIKCKFIIIASGRVPKTLGLPNEESLIGRGISFCAICDGYFYKDKVVVVIGGGNSAVEEAIYLSSICKKVIIVHRKDKFTADESTQDVLKIKENIEINYNSVIKTLNVEDSNLKSIIITKNGVEEEIKTDGIFMYIGYTPDISFLKNLDIEINHNYIVVDDGMRTSIKNIYACGDITSKDVYQITTAVGDGAIAASSVKKDIS